MRINTPLTGVTLVYVHFSSLLNLHFFLRLYIFLSNFISFLFLWQLLRLQILFLPLPFSISHHYSLPAQLSSHSFFLTFSQPFLDIFLPFSTLLYLFLSHFSSSSINFIYPLRYPFPAFFCFIVYLLPSFLLSFIIFLLPHLYFSSFVIFLLFQGCAIAPSPTYHEEDRFRPQVSL